MTPLKVKLSPVDRQAPDTVEVVYQLLGPRHGRAPPMPIFKSTDIEEVQKRSDEMTKRLEPHTFSTYWRDRKTQSFVQKWNVLRSGTYRHYRVTIPWVEDITHDHFLQKLIPAVEKLNPKYVGQIKAATLPPVERAPEITQAERECLEDLRTHYSDFRNAFKAMPDPEGYWQHQIFVLDRMFVLAGGKL